MKSIIFYMRSVDACINSALRSSFSLSKCQKRQNDLLFEVNMSTTIEEVAWDNYIWFVCVFIVQFSSRRSNQKVSLIESPIVLCSQFSYHQIVCVFCLFFFFHSFSGHITLPSETLSVNRYCAHWHFIFSFRFYITKLVVFHQLNFTISYTLDNSPSHIHTHTPTVIRFRLEIK